MYILQVGELSFSDMWYHIQVQLDSDGSRIQSQVWLQKIPLFHQILVLPGALLKSLDEGI